MKEIMTKITKPCLAQDVNEDNLYLPLIASCKIDGVFTLIQNGKALARSLKPHENKYITEFYSNPLFEGLRGELIAGDDPTAEGLIRETSSVTRRIEGESETTLFVFDYVTEDSKDLPYMVRLELAKNKVEDLNFLYGYNNFKIIPYEWCRSIEEYTCLKEESMNQSYEGVILRDPNLPHKEGRSSTKKIHLWRWKPWLDAEIKVTGLTEGQSNQNIATTNELGKTKRSTHKENMQPNSQVGSIQGILLKDLVDCFGKVIKEEGEQVTISPGEMTAKEKKFYFENPQEIVGKIAKFKYFAYSLKDTGRFMSFVCIRSERDMS